jgi:hypothetical protein
LADNTFIKSNLEKNEKTPSYLAVDKQKLTITYLREPVEGEVEKKLIEFYSRKKAK